MTWSKIKNLTFGDLSLFWVGPFSPCPASLLSQWATLTRSGASTARTSGCSASTPSPWRISLTTTGPRSARGKAGSNGVAGASGHACLQSAPGFRLKLVEATRRSSGSDWLLLISLPQRLSRVFLGRRNEADAGKGWEECCDRLGSECPGTQRHPQVGRG